MKIESWENTWKECPQCDREATILREMNTRDGDILMKEYHQYCEECKLPFETFVPMEQREFVK